MKLLVGIIVLILMSECEGPVEPTFAGIDSSVSGKIIALDKDGEINGAENIKVRIAEYLAYNNTFPNPTTYEFIQFVDSSYTNDQGVYDFSFTTTGSGSDYFLEIEKPDNLYFYFFSRYEIEDIGSNNILEDISSKILYPIEFMINSSEVESYPLTISNRTYSGGYFPRDTILTEGIHQYQTYGDGQSDYNESDTLKLTFRIPGDTTTYKDYTLNIPNPEINYEGINEIILNESEFTD